MKKIAIFASGSGSNAENIARYFKNHKFLKVALMLSNNPQAYVLKRAEKLGIPVYVFNRDDLYKDNNVKERLLNEGIDFIVLAGFLWLIPSSIIRAWPNRIINIHPALLPGYGGKGMYGDRVHQKVYENGEPESGITIHYVNEHYDEGQIIHQARFPIEKGEGPDEIAQKAHELEYREYPRVIEKLLAERG
ncbi:MAG: phosphoribosylglycinamide formyltransferase [Bacteroidales bacterium]|nr:phosphoribosylglycinamide formyltransferase [Bacteroidales bacterium]